MGVYRIILSLLAFSVPFTAAGLVLENKAIRIELDPQTFSVRFLGRPGGPNFIDPVYLTKRERNLPGLVMPGGVMTDVLPVSEENAPLRRGPASVMAHEQDYLLLMGPKSVTTGLQVKKEYRVHRDEPRVTYKLSVLSSFKEQRGVSIRVTAQVPWGSTLEMPKPEDGHAGLIHGDYPGFSAMSVEGGQGYRVSLAGRSGRAQAVLRIPVQQVAVVTPFGVWSRTTTLSSAGEGGDSQIELFAFVDDYSATCQVALEGRQTGVNVGAPLVFIEDWTLKDSAPRATAGNDTVERDGSEY